MRKVSDYQSLILDVDGVIFDSNTLKENNIRAVAAEFLTGDRLSEFINYFIGGNGIPRETKIAAFFGQDSAEYHQVLEAYNALNGQTLYTVAQTKGAGHFLKKYSGMSIWAVSGGAENEVKELFNRNQLTKYFKGIHGGPVSKKEYLQLIDPPAPVLYVGDSKVDHETARHTGTDFCFMYAYTQFHDWEKYFRDYPEVRVIENLSQL